MRKVKYTIEVESDKFSVADICKTLNSHKDEIEKRINEATPAATQSAEYGSGDCRQTVCIKIGPVWICVSADVLLSS